MNHASDRKWIWLLLLFIALLALSILLLASGSRAAPMAQADATPTQDAAAATAEPDAAEAPSSIDYAMYFRSRAQDSDECSLAAQDGKLVVGDSVSNPAMSCPDMFSWKLLIEAIQDEFWQNWAADQYTWPAEPYPLCQPDAEDRSTCCTAGSLTNPGYDDPDNPGKHCPYFPADHLAAGGEPTMLEAKPPALAQNHHFAAPAPEDPSEPGRVIRQEMAELVFRNQPMFDYVFDNNIYHTNGLSEVFNRNQADLTNRAPYRQRNAPGELVEIDFPMDAVMIKTNWLNEKRAQEMGLADDPENPYITMEINSPVTDDNGTVLEPGLHYLVAMHITSKDIPNWIWATFEHVKNPGRCDLIGCNDSFGYFTPDQVAADQHANYVVPRTQSDDLIIPSVIFDPGQMYAGGERNPMLEAIFQQLGIGASEQQDPLSPSAADRGWLSYRLKGSQNDFTDATGRANMVGNSITEAGFVNSSSCMTCHGRASVNDQGKPPLGVFVSELNENGYPQGATGVPDPDWYFSSSSEPSLNALQTDFVWGIFFANDLVTPES